jgi:hypothetical protein|tara:strand:+ start:38710 stop:38949 length:240 start_codon:yes stop_codon:yes gene_type:complete
MPIKDNTPNHHLYNGQLVEMYNWREWNHEPVVGIIVALNIKDNQVYDAHTHHIRVYWYNNHKVETCIMSMLVPYNETNE